MLEPALEPAPVIQPAENPQPHVTTSAPSSPAGNSFSEKLRAATDATLKKFNIVRTGRGRPKNDGSPEKSDVVAPVAGGAAAPGAVAVVENADPVRAAFDSPAHQLFRRVVSKLAASEISFLTAVVEIKAEAAGLEDQFIKQAVTAAAPAPKAFDDVGESADLVAIKYGWNVDKLPEIALGADLLAMHLPFAKLFMALNSEIKRKRAAERPAPAPEPQITK